MASLSSGRALSVRWLLWQCGVVGALAIVYYLLAGPRASNVVLPSVILGGLVSLLANGYFAWKLFTHTGARAAQRIVANLYMAEAVKLLISAASLAWIFSWKTMDPVAVLVGFVVTYLSSLIIVGVLTLRS